MEFNIDINKTSKKINIKYPNNCFYLNENTFCEILPTDYKSDVDFTKYSKCRVYYKSYTYFIKNIRFRDLLLTIIQKYLVVLNHYIKIVR